MAVSILCPLLHFLQKGEPGKHFCFSIFISSWKDCIPDNVFGKPGQGSKGGCGTKQSGSGDVDFGGWGSG